MFVSLSFTFTFTSGDIAQELCTESSLGAQHWFYTQVLPGEDGYLAHGNPGLDPQQEQHEHMQEQEVPLNLFFLYYPMSHH